MGDLSMTHGRLDGTGATGNKSDRSRRASMPIIDINLVAGHEPDEIEQLILALTRATSATLHIAPDRVRVLVHEIPPAHWAVGGTSFAVHDPREQ
jgi:4-oxalocrotonate tautomerase